CTRRVSKARGTQRHRHRGRKTVQIVPRATPSNECSLTQPRDSHQRTVPDDSVSRQIALEVKKKSELFAVHGHHNVGVSAPATVIRRAQRNSLIRIAGSVRTARKKPGGVNDSNTYFRPTPAIVNQTARD